MRRLILGIAAALALSACGHAGVKPGNAGGTPPVDAAGIETITYETGPCFGACPVFRVTVSSDGKAVFTGIRHTQVIGERRFAVTPQQYLTFREQLAPWLPESGEKLYQPGSPLCKQVATDLPSVDISLRKGARSRRLYYYYGCDNEKNMTMGEALGTATDALPLDALVGEIP
ncbi:DUF6438 domain-containing protein [Sphingomonas sp. LB-2]|uniref:DUF6438 domain-containing protein n=1 Tax=Sphingomonas caeni TaxID=2984949 RepID=UPI0022315F5C|nr:DUF6438 domain-containing protein [Sphingomonas caeni]MCW3846061.1 DUF6438 domain-containing protein [Sphingomonas caeni]